MKKKTDDKETDVPPVEETEAAEVVTEAPAPAPEKVEEEPLREQLLRLRADFDNYRKRVQRERNELFLFANESLISDLLPVIDHFEMGMKSAENHNADGAMLDGFRLVYNQLTDVMKKFNASPIDAIGAAFDPHRHEALTHLPSAQPAETVIEQTRRGWMLGDKLLRAAQVVVSSGPAAEQEA